MQPLRDVIRTFQKEITAALAEAGQGDEPGHGLSWKAERAILSLEVILDPSGTPCARPHPNEASLEGMPGHRLQIEFALSGSANHRIDAPRPATARGSHGHEAANVHVTEESQPDVVQAYEDLAALLGRPGFDSSARAAVFCEALQQLTLPQAFALCGALTSPAAEVEDESLRRARHQILGIVRSGSLKSPEKAAEILSRVFEHWPLPSLVRFVIERWKTEDNWAE